MESNSQVNGSSLCRIATDSMMMSEFVTKLLVIDMTHQRNIIDEPCDIKVINLCYKSHISQ